MFDSNDGVLSIKETTGFAVINQDRILKPGIGFRHRLDIDIFYIYIEYCEGPQAASSSQLLLLQEFELLSHAPPLCSFS